MEFWCRITVDGVPRLGLRRDEQMLIHEGDLFSKPLWYTEHPQTKVTSIPSAITGTDGVYLANYSAKTPGLHRMDNPFNPFTK